MAMLPFFYRGSLTVDVQHPAQYSVFKSSGNTQSARINLMLKALELYHQPVHVLETVDSTVREHSLDLMKALTPYQI